MIAHYAEINCNVARRTGGAICASVAVIKTFFTCFCRTIGVPAYIALVVAQLLRDIIVRVTGGTSPSFVMHVAKFHIRIMITPMRCKTKNTTLNNIRRSIVEA